MGLFRKKHDPISEKAQVLNAQIETLQAQVASQFVAPTSLGNTPQQQTPGSGSTIAAKAPAEPIETPILVAPNPASSIARERPAQPARAFRTHTVRAGETPYSIARSYGIKVDALLTANPGLNAHRMKSCQTINVPQP